MAALPTTLSTLVDWTTSGTGAYNALDVIAIDVFSGTNATTGVACDPSSTGYAASLAKWTNSYMPLLKSSGKILRIGQMQHPTWCLCGGTGTGEAAAYRGRVISCGRLPDCKTPGWASLLVGRPAKA